jgi:hypothetical protein
VRVVSVVVVSVLLTTAAGCATRHSATDAQAAAVPSAGASRPLSAEDMRVDDSEVAAGLGRLKTVVNEVADSVGSDSAAAQDAQGRIEPIWSSIEGTVKAAEPETYRRFEDEFALIQKALSPADPVKARAAADAVVKAADGYLARHSAGSAQPGEDDATEPGPPAASPGTAG